MPHIANTIFRDHLWLGEDPAEMNHEMVLDPWEVDSYWGDVLLDTELPQGDHLQAKCSRMSSPLFVHIIHCGGIVGDYACYSPGKHDTCCGWPEAPAH